MWVLSVKETGWSDESMRVATFTEVRELIEADPDGENTFEMRWESDSPHPHNHVALGQLRQTTGWVDYARDTPAEAIAWAERQPEGKARVVDWISREVMWP